MPSEGARMMLINSDYPLDKVVYLHEGSYSSVPGNSEYSVNHGLPFTPLIKAVWSTTPDFSVTYNIGDGVPDSNPDIVFSPYAFDVRSDADKAYVVFVNSHSTLTIYVRIWGYMPSNINLPTAPTSINGDMFIFNSEYNYTKLYMKGVTASSSVPGSTEAISHSLGYRPQSETWHVRDGYTYFTSFAEIVGGLPDADGAYMTDSQLVMQRSNYITGSEYFHYRIYLDAI